MGKTIRNAPYITLRSKTHREWKAKSNRKFRKKAKSAIKNAVDFGEFSFVEPPKKIQEVSSIWDSRDYQPFYDRRVIGYSLDSFKRVFDEDCLKWTKLDYKSVRSNWWKFWFK